MSAAATALATASALQLAANRANALHSTGPITAQGKLASSRNALSHGLTTADALLPVEDPSEYALHHQTHVDHYRPRGPIARALVTELADLEWRLRRVPAFEAQLLSVECHKLTSNPDLAPLVKKLQSDSQILAVAFTRLVENKVLPNLLNQESRIARRADRIRRRLEQLALERPRPATAEPNHEPQPEPEIAMESEMENRKNEPIPIGAPRPHEAPQQAVRVHKIGRNEPCPCRSGLKFKRCCLNSRAASTLSAGSAPESA